MKLLSSCRVVNWYNTCSCWYIVSFRRVLMYSTTAAATLPAPELKSGRDSLYRRISPMGHWSVSIVPVLDQWIEEGRNVTKHELRNIIKELRRYRRFKHALEVSHWMSDKRYFRISAGDMAIRMDLFSRVHGIEEAEKYFHDIPNQAKDMEVYCALLNCYARVKFLEKAEEIWERMRNLGLAMDTLCYNIMLNLYHQTRRYEKLDSLLHEMDEKGIKWDKFTFTIRLTAYAATSDSEGMNKFVQRMESDPGVVLDWNAYATAANGYMKFGFVDKALAMLKKSEELILPAKRSSNAFDFLLTQYATTGKKDEVLRLWELYKKTEKIFNKGYISMITSLLKFDDIEGAEKVFEEWESSQSCYDFRVPNFLLGVYSKKGLMEKAEALINRAKAKGGKPLTHTWYYLATGYVGVDQISKAVEAMEVAISLCEPGWKPSKATLVACLEYLKQKGDVEEAQEFVKSLGAKGIVSADVHKKLLNYLKNGTENSNVMEAHPLVRDGEAHEILELEEVDALVEDEQINQTSELK